ncbi:uncharacterized protein LOC121776937 [Salvia splendens]|uniref:uncharacterized protein LOC121776937 n=1 Tax=Salvia splendens TaxID=180675 RepID=UPI001C26004C|nr:uncharacterized protein LOC121776937 [Salvia splendens]
MTTKDIAQMMMQDIDGGPDFKKLFMFMLENVVIETPADGNCKPKIMHFIDDASETRVEDGGGTIVVRKDGTGTGSKSKTQTEKATKKSAAVEESVKIPASAKGERAEIPVDKTTQPIKEGATKGGKGKQLAIPKKPASAKGKDIKIGIVKTTQPSKDVAGKGGSGKELTIPKVVAKGKGKGKQIQQDEAGDVEATNLATSRLKKASLAARSPLNERAVRLTAKPNNVDKEVYYWVLSTTDKNKDSVVYQDSFRKTVPIEFQSLASFKAVSPAIIDTWSSYLNNMEKLKVQKMVAQVRKSSIYVMTMHWRNNICTMETGVYVMRHMETYFGEREKE